MCGIVGYIGTCQAAPVLLDGLSKLEYRGYDSAGIAVYDGNKIQMQKAMGRLKVLEEMTQNGATLPGTVGIGHTRWATHGAPSDLNAHPHFNKDHSIVVVHNGIIENYLKLKKKLMSKGYEFLSETDTEVIAHMLDYYYNGDPLATITKVMHRMEGSYALGILFRDYPDEVYAVRKDSPLIVGTSKSGNLIASDVPAVLKYTRDVYFLENEEIVKLTRDGLHFYNIDEEELEKEATHIDWDMNAAEKGGYEHFMLKEMHEQPKAVKDTLTPRIKNGDVVIEELGMTDEEIRAIRKIFIVACGSAYHTGVTSKYIFEKLARIPVEVDLASEFRYRDPVIDGQDVVIAISQSGETADTLAAVELAKSRGAFIYGICNAIGSSIPRATHTGSYIHVGPEIGVASTKAFTGQVTVLAMLALTLAKTKGTIDEQHYLSIVQELNHIPEKMKEVLELNDTLAELSKTFTYAHNFIYLGRGYSYPVALEGALKLKEISYIHAEGYPAAEMKHGPIALIDAEMPVVVIATQNGLYEKVVSNIQEIKARKGKVIAFVTKGDTVISKIADCSIELPETIECLDPLITTVPLQLLAYHIAVCKGMDVDQPRNLAKSVTVE